MLTLILTPIKSLLASLCDYHSIERKFCFAMRRMLPGEYESQV